MKCLRDAGIPASPITVGGLTVFIFDRPRLVLAFTHPHQRWGGSRIPVDALLKPFSPEKRKQELGWARRTARDHNRALRAEALRVARHSDLQVPVVPPKKEGPERWRATHALATALAASQLFQAAWTAELRAADDALEEGRQRAAAGDLPSARISLQTVQGAVQRCWAMVAREEGLLTEAIECVRTSRTGPCRATPTEAIKLLRAVARRLTPLGHPREAVKAVRFALQGRPKAHEAVFASLQVGDDAVEDDDAPPGGAWKRADQTWVQPRLHTDATALPEPCQRTVQRLGAGVSVRDWKEARQKRLTESRIIG